MRLILANSSSVLALAAVAVLLSACGPHAPAGPPNGMGGPAEVGVITIAPSQAALSTELSGRTSAYLASDVRPQVNGVIKARHFVEGGEVKAGQSLYEIDPALYEASLHSAEASLAQAQAAYATAKLKADRYKDLVKINAVSRQDFDDAQATAQQDAATVLQQKAAVDTARINLAYTQVKAPISGRIGRSAVTPGALVTADQATALATIQALDPIYVDVTQSSADLLRLRQDLASGKYGKSDSVEVGLTLEDGSVYPLKGKLAFSEVSVDSGTGTVVLRAVFPNPKGVLLPGMYVRANINTLTVSDAILVPQTAVARDPKGNGSVMIALPNGMVEPRPVVTGPMVGDKWLITSGLKPGDVVIVEGLQKVRPGAPVHAVPAGSVAPGPQGPNAK